MRVTSGRIYTVNSLPYAYNRMGGHKLGINLPALYQRVIGRPPPVVPYVAGEHIFDQGAPLEAYYIVKTGQVKVTRLASDGNGLTLCIPSRGESFCPLPLVQGKTHIGEAMAVTDCTLTVIPLEDFQRLCSNHPGLTQAIQQASFFEVKRLLRRLEMNSFRPLETRIAFILLGAKLPHRTNSQGLTEVTITHQEIAGLAGTTRESVSRIIARWIKNGTVASTRGCIIILKADRLHSMIQHH